MSVCHNIDYAVYLLCWNTVAISRNLTDNAYTIVLWLSVTYAIRH